MAEFDDLGEFLHRRIPPTHFQEDGPNLPAIFRWDYDPDVQEDGLSVDRASITGPDARRFFAADRRHHGVASLTVGQLNSPQASVYSFHAVHMPVDGNPAHCEVHVLASGIVVKNPGKFCKPGVIFFRAWMKTLYLRGELLIDPPIQQA